jgi:hypothetical protein
MKVVFTPKGSVRVRVVAVAVFLLAATGCGKGNNAPVLMGKVTYNNQPVTGGNIWLVPTAPPGQGKPVSYLGVISSQGTYIISGAPAGEMKVVVETESLRLAAQGPPIPSNLPPQAAQTLQKLQQRPDAQHYVQIPFKFSDPNQTPLRMTTAGGKQAYDIQLAD